jgi:hypothetical protein
MNWHARVREEFGRLGKPVDETVVEELAQHAAAAVQAARADGASPAEADAASVALIALAIAAATSIVGVVNGIVLKPLPRVNMDGLVRVGEYSDKTGDSGRSISNELYHAWQGDWNHLHRGAGNDRRRDPPVARLLA